MKVSLITLHYIKNYGSVLQTFATQKKFESLGYEVEVVNYERTNSRNSNDETSHTNSLLNTALRCVRKHLITAPKERALNKFLNSNIHFSTVYNNYAELRQNPPKADIYCTGSDQMWNSIYNGGILPEYFLDYAPEGKPKVAYSTSFGRDELSDAEMRTTEKYIHKFKAISVREFSGLQLLEQMNYPSGVHILDPTLVLDHEQWKNMIATSQIKRPYVFFYQLNINHAMEQFAKSLAAGCNCELVTFTGSIRAIFGKGKIIFAPKVEVFLSLIENAQYVVTDSFHGTAFSINFNKQVFVFYPSLYSTRLESLLKLTGQEYRAIKDDTTDYRIIPAIDYEKVNIVLETERAKATNFIIENMKI